MSHNWGRSPPRCTGRWLRWGVMGTVSLAVLALALLAVAPGVALARDPRIVEIEAFVATPSPPVPTASYAFALEVSYDDSLPGWVTGSVFELVSGRWRLLVEGCSYSTCTANVEADAPEGLYSPRDRTFKAVLYNEGSEYDSRALVVHERRPHFTIDVDLESSPGYFTTYIEESEGGTELSTVIYEDGSAVERCDIYWSYCNAAMSTGHVYYASVEDPEGHVYGISPSYLATSSTTATKETTDKVDLVRLGALYAGTSDVCTMLLGYDGTHVGRSSVSDQELACEAAVTGRETMSNVLRAVAAAGGGTAVLWWLEHQVTIQTLSPSWPTTPWPDYDLPAPGALPQVWQGAVINLADHYMIHSKDLTQTAAETIAAACLWNGSRITNARDDCANLPIFISGSDVEEATNHDLEAISGLNGATPHPQWAKLNYEASGAKSGTRNWYRSVAPCDRLGRTEQQCDEYPFWATEQGGPLAPVQPHLKYISRSDNTYQGSRYGSFVTVCGLRTGTPQSGANATGGTTFLMIPIPPSLGIPTGWLCN